MVNKVWFIMLFEIEVLKLNGVFVGVLVFRLGVLSLWCKEFSVFGILVGGFGV